MSVKERDPLTGHQTTGHEWNGITELNTPVPRIIWWFILVTHIYALILWVLLPTWPLVTTYTKGVLGIDQREQVAAQMDKAYASRADWVARIKAEPVEAIRADPQLSAIVAETGPALFGDNCAACHGSRGQGGPGFPSLVDDAWLWGGTPDDILETLRVGINAPHPDTRYAEMPAFDGVLSWDEMQAAASYVRSLSGQTGDADQIAAGKVLFSENCAACHGENAQGSTDVGAPNLTDTQWIYGGDADTVFTTIRFGRSGWMPTWESRLGLSDRKLLTAYLMDLKSAEDAR